VGDSCCLLVPISLESPLWCLGNAIVRTGALSTRTLVCDPPLDDDRALEEQIAEKNARKRQESAEREEWERKKDAELGVMDYFGSGGGGAPLKAQGGGVVSDLRQASKASKAKQQNKQGERFACNIFLYDSDVVGAAHHHHPCSLLWCSPPFVGLRSVLPPSSIDGVPMGAASPGAPGSGGPRRSRASPSPDPRARRGGYDTGASPTPEYGVGGGGGGERRDSLPGIRHHASVPTSRSGTPSSSGVTARNEVVDMFREQNTRLRVRDICFFAPRLSFTGVFFVVNPYARYTLLPKASPAAPQLFLWKVWPHSVACLSIGLFVCRLVYLAYAA
jgi:hypothetical protein